MGVIRERETPVVVDEDTARIRQVEAGDMTVEFDDLAQHFEMDELFRGLPNDMCQAEHWGYVIEGEMRYVTADGSEIIALPGDAYYVPAGHLPHTGTDGAKVVEFSRTADLAETMQVIDRNMAELQQGS